MARIKKTTTEKIKVTKTVKKQDVKEKTVAKDSMELTVVNTKGQKAGTISVSKEIFAAKVNPVLMAQAVRVFLANQRQGNASTKTRSMVTGSTRKIYKQKGTGRARHGDIKAPIFIGGGVAHGPHPRDFSLVFPKMMRRKSLFSALTAKLSQKEVVTISGLLTVEKKTKDMMEILRVLELRGTKEKKIKKVLIVIPQKVENVRLAARNIEGVKMEMANLLTTYEVLRSDVVLFMKEALPVLEKTYLTN